jgi:acyl-CoA synthetase (NDP forming)
LAARTVRTMSEWESVDFLILAVLPGILLAHAHVKVLAGHVEALGRVARDVKKPLLVVLRTGGVAKSEEAAQGMQAEFQKAGFPVFRTVDSAARAVVRLISHHERRRV